MEDENSVKGGSVGVVADEVPIEEVEDDGNDEISLLESLEMFFSEQEERKKQRRRGIK